MTHKDSSASDGPASILSIRRPLSSSSSSSSDNDESVNRPQQLQITETHAHTRHADDKLSRSNPSLSSSSSSSLSLFKLQQHLEPGADFTRSTERPTRRKATSQMSVESVKKEGLKRTGQVLVVSRRFSRHERSPVYSDRFVYKNQPLLAKETCLLQTSRRNVIPKLSILSTDDSVDFMPIFKLVKPNAAGIFYNVGLPLDDEDDLRSCLEPSILLLNTPHQSFRSAGSSSVARVRHRLLHKGYSRISEKGASSNKGSAALDFKLNIVDYDFVTRNWTGSSAAGRDIVEEDVEQNRTSLLMLEPLLLVSSDRSERRFLKYEKERLARIEQLKLIKIVIAYIIIFTVSLSLTFYIVYFS